MQDEITQLFFSEEPIDEFGRMYLCDRGLRISTALKNGTVSRGDLIYFLYSHNGIFVRWKARSMSDKKKQFMSTISDDDQKHFKMPFYFQYKAPSCDYLIITEGEFDCIALTQLGEELGPFNCVSLPNGSGSVESAFRNNYEFLQQFKIIYIAFDMDAPGQEAAKKAMKLIPPTKYRRIIFPLPYKDANEWLFNDQPTSQDLEKLMTNAQRIESPSITHIRDLPLTFYDPIKLGISTGWNELDKILGGFRTGEVTVITGDTGVGKSTFAINFMRNIAEQGHGIWINSYEMNPIIVNRKLASVVLRKPLKLNDFHHEDITAYEYWYEYRKVHINMSTARVDLKILRNQIEMASLAYDIKYILIDHLDYIHANGTKATTLENIDDAMRELHLLAMEFDVGILLVVHPVKVPSNKEMEMNDIKGSSSIKQYADNIIIMTRMERLDANDIFRIRIRICKNRLVGTERYFDFRFNPDIEGYE